MDYSDMGAEKPGQTKIYTKICAVTAVFCLHKNLWTLIDNLSRKMIIYSIAHSSHSNAVTSLTGCRPFYLDVFIPFICLFS